MTRFNKHIGFLSLFVLAAIAAGAQETMTPLPGYKSVVVRDKQLDLLIDTLKERNVMHPTIKGFRIQVYTGTERKEALEMKSELQKTFPELQAYIIYQQPYFKVRIGDYRNQAEAQADYSRLQGSGKFNKAFLVPDEINLPSVD